MNKTKGVARIFGRGEATKKLLIPKNNKKRSPLFFGFSYRLFAPLIGFRRPLELFVPPHTFFPPTLNVNLADVLYIFAANEAA